MTIDFSNPSHYLLALLPETVLSVWAMMLLLIDVFQKGDSSKPSSRSIAWLALVGIILAAVANGWLLTLDATSQTGMIALDEFRVFTNFLFLLAAALFVLISGRYLDREFLQLGEVHVLVLLATVGMMVFGSSNDLMVAFIGLEMMSLPVYVLTGINRRDRRSAEGALKYFLLGAFSSAFFLFGVALIYGATQTTVLPLIASAAASQSDSLLLIGGIGMLTVGFGFKVAAVPFHMWTPDAYEGAPAPVTAFMAAGIKAAAFAAFLRVFLTAFPALHETWGLMIFWLAIATMITANLIALVEGNVKRMLAYSSIAHAGYLLVALATGSTMGAASYLFYLVVYTLMTIGAFAVVFVVGRTGESRLDLDAYSGLAWEKPLLGIVMTIFLLSLAGFPFTGGFIGKVYILQSAVTYDLVPLAVVLVLTSLVSYWYYLRMAWYMWFREAVAAPAGAEAITLSGTTKFALVIAAVLVVILGVLPNELLEAAERSAASLSIDVANFGLK
ncbi:MAG TPA: NADH-quinone oxidoreductase subunit N [Longimicrobiales bacterium]|nr:NADH-quinone oxidoreductase subunit N [Longimicrobiales bacterium]